MFVPLFVDIMKPLNKLLRKDTKFQWSTQCQSAFEHLKKVLYNKPIPQYPGIHKSYTLSTDASSYAYSSLFLELVESNYRLVSNLPFLSKVVEKCVLLRFSEHCERHELMPDYQSAYGANYSCETALVRIMDDILWSMENQEVVPLIVIDLSAAFDTVDHDLLLAVLRKKFGMDQVALKWFRSYLRQ